MRTKLKNREIFGLERAASRGTVLSADKLNKVSNVDYMFLKYTPNINF